MLNVTNETINVKVIGVICIKTKPGYETWFKKRKPRYVEYRKVKGIDGNDRIVSKSYSYDIKFDNEGYETFVNAPDQESMSMLAKEIVDSLSNLDRLSRKVKDFDKERFKNDIINYFRENGLL